MQHDFKFNSTRKNIMNYIYKQYNMVFWTMKWVIMSVVMILVMHHLYIFFMDTLTVPMNKDFIHKPIEKYKEMLDTIRNVEIDRSPENIIPEQSSLPSVLQSTSVIGNSILDTPTMQNELQTFFNDLKQDKKEPARERSFQHLK